jgi:hypothetical protein
MTMLRNPLMAPERFTPPAGPWDRRRWFDSLELPEPDLTIGAAAGEAMVGPHLRGRR